MTRYGAPLLMIVVGLIQVYFTKVSVLSPHVCSGMVYGGAYPQNVDRDVFVAIEGTPFQKSAVTQQSAVSIDNLVKKARDYPQPQLLEQMATRLLKSKWYDPGIAIAQIWNIRVAPQAPLLLEPWVVPPPEESFVEVTAVEVSVYQLSYDRERSQLKSKLLVGHTEQTKE